MIIAQVSITPIGVEVSVHEYVKIAIDEIRKSGLNFETNAMATVIESKSLDELFNVIKKAHHAVLKKGAKRVITEIKIDDRRDKDATMRSKIEAVEK